MDLTLDEALLQLEQQAGAVARLEATVSELREKLHCTETQSVSAIRTSASQLKQAMVDIPSELPRHNDARKFSAIPSDFDLSYGSHEEYSNGLSTLVGPPVFNAADLQKAVEDEHRRYEGLEVQQSKGALTYTVNPWKCQRFRIYLLFRQPHKVGCTFISSYLHMSY